MQQQITGWTCKAIALSAGAGSPFVFLKLLLVRLFSQSSHRAHPLLTVNPARWYSLLRTAGQPCQSTTSSHKAFFQPAADACILAPSQPVHGCFAWDVALPRNPSARSRASGRGQRATAQGHWSFVTPARATQSGDMLLQQQQHEASCLEALWGCLHHAVLQSAHNCPQTSSAKLTELRR